MKPVTSMLLTALLALGLTSAVRAGDDSELFTQGELDQMLAPIALYPDTVLSHVLIAATYPLEVVQAARWTRDNPGLTGEEAASQAEAMTWDPSIKALTAFPELLDRMDRDIEWTQRLGDAFLLQEGDVLATIQKLRGEAYARGYLETNEHVRVVRETEYIYVEPAHTHVVYLPYYDPWVVYGPWWWPAYPPHYWHHPTGYSLGLTFYWGSGYAIPPGFYFSAFHWPRHQLVIIDPYYGHGSRHGHGHSGRHGRPDHRFRSGRELARHDGARHWRHDPRHRRGVNYRDGVNRDRFRPGDDTLPVRAGPEQLAREPRIRDGSRGVKVRGEQRAWAARKRDNLALTPVNPAGPKVRKQRPARTGRSPDDSTARLPSAPPRSPERAQSTRTTGHDASRTGPGPTPARDRATRARDRLVASRERSRDAGRQPLTERLARTNPGSFRGAAPVGPSDRQPDRSYPALPNVGQRPATPTRTRPGRLELPSASGRATAAAPRWAETPSHSLAGAARAPRPDLSAPTQRAPEQRAAPERPAHSRRSAPERDTGRSDRPADFAGRRGPARGRNR